jgi:nucleoside-diphosphate-sugar epimerase
MQILFIGGSGNISTECATLLANRGHEVLALTRGQSRLPKGLRPVKADRKDIALMRKTLEGLKPEVVINFLGFEVAELAIDFELFKGRVRQYIFISSATVYEKPPRKLPIREDAPLGNPWWDYAQKKIECENWLRERAERDGFPVTIVRPSHTYSKIWIPNPIASSSYTFAARLEQGRPVFVPDNGENPWTLTAVSDFAVGLAGLVGNGKALGEALHITSDEVLTWNQICEEITAALVEAARTAKRPALPRPIVLKIPTDFICQHAPEVAGNIKGDKMHPGVFDNAKIKRFVPEFACRKPFREGIREAVGWLQAHPEDQHLKPELEKMMGRVVEAWRGQ